MNKQVESFLDEVCRHIRCRAVHKEIRRELSLHIEDLTEAYLKQGMDEEDAARRAVLDMGSGEAIGRQLNDQHKPQTDWLLVGLTGLFAIFGIVMMYISSGYENQGIPFGRYMVYVCLGIGAMAGLYFFDYTKLKKWAWVIYIGTALLLGATSLTGVMMNGARNWIAIGPFYISTASIAPVMFVIAFAGFFDRYKEGGLQAVFKLLALAAVSFGLMITQSQRSTAVLMMSVLGVMLIYGILKHYFGGSRRGQLLLWLVFYTLWTGGVIAAIFKNAIVMDRLFSGVSGAGYVREMAGKWLGAAQFFGEAGTIPDGALQATMPGLTTEYILVNFITNLGWITGIVLTLLAGILIIRLMLITRKIRPGFGLYLSLGASALLSLQFAVGICINFNLIPPMGVSMPFISYGGSGYVMSMVLMGLILSVWRRNRMIFGDHSKREKWIQFVNGKLIIHVTDRENKETYT